MINMLIVSSPHQAPVRVPAATYGQTYGDRGVIRAGTSAKKPTTGAAPNTILTPSSKGKYDTTQTGAVSTVVATTTLKG